MPASSESATNESFSSLRSITRGASVYLVGTGFNNVLGLLFNLLVPRVFGAGLYGVYSYGYTLAMIASGFALFGTDKSILKFIPEHEDNPAEQNRILGLVSLTALGGGVVVGAAIYAFAPEITELTLGNPLLTDVLRIFALFVPLQTLVSVVVSVFQSLELPEYQMAILNGIMPAFRLLGAALAVAIGATIVGLTAAVVAAIALTLVVALALMLSRTSLRPAGESSKTGLTEFYKFSLPLTFQRAGTLLYNQTDILMVGIFLAGSSVGIYKISWVMSRLLRIPLGGFNQLFPPIASRLYTNGEFAELDSLYARVTRWIFTLSLFPAIAAIIYSSELLLLFGPGFSRGEPVLVLFVLAQLTNAGVGPSNYVLIMTEHQYLAVTNDWLVGGLNVVLNYVFIQSFGLIGAAVASAGVLAGVNILRVIEIWYTERLFPYSMKFLKPLLAGLAAAVVMYGLQTVLSGYVLLFVGGAVGAVAYVAVLVVLGVEREDREFFAETVPGFGD